MTPDEAVAHILEEAPKTQANESFEVEVEGRTFVVVRLWESETNDPCRAEFIIADTVEAIRNVDAHRGFMWLTHSNQPESMVRGALNRLLHP